jgi:methionyl-tRNA formyltransferase
MRIIFAGTPHFAEIQLQALLGGPHQIVAVYTQPDKPSGRGQHLSASPVKQCAIAHGIPVEQPISLKSTEAESIFAGYASDVMIVAAYGLILPRFFLEYPRYGCINVHASLLPRWRGASPIQQAILAGDSETGITLMKMDEGLDTGGILTQVACPLLLTETAEDLHNKLATLGAYALKTTLDSIVEKVPVPQDPKQVAHAPKILKEQALCNWRLSAVEIERGIRAFQPWPIMHATLDDQLVRLWQATVMPVSSSEVPGTILEQSEKGLLVATGDQGLLITQAQLPGKKILPMAEILKSRQTFFAVGRRFNS